MQRFEKRERTFHVGLTMWHGPSVDSLITFLPSANTNSFISDVDGETAQPLVVKCQSRASHSRVITGKRFPGTTKGIWQSRGRCGSASVPGSTWRPLSGAVPSKMGCQVCRSVDHSGCGLVTAAGLRTICATHWRIRVDCPGAVSRLHCLI
ncbi:MAG: hypothetical protein ACI9R3_001564 [Verrucomicrobiales bacterium]|jgi:hypothetical protein